MRKPPGAPGGSCPALFRGDDLGQVGWQEGKHRNLLRGLGRHWDRTPIAALLHQGQPEIRRRDNPCFRSGTTPRPDHVQG
jgi:hypothetical protein